MPGWEVIGDEERDEVLDVFAHGGVLFRHGFDAKRQGSYKVVEFERAFATWIGAAHAQAVSSGTAAVKVALDALGIGPGDEVVTQCFTFVATVEAILATGARPVITEVDDTFCMDPVDLANRVSERTRAIIPVHMMGGPADLAAILPVAESLDAPVVEDTAQALGGTFGDRRLGTIGTIGTFSFDFGKTLTTGEGGMVVTNDEGLWRRARGAHDHGHDSNPAFPRGEDTRSAAGFNYRMTELQGAVGLAQLRKLDTILAAQQANWQQLYEMAPPVDGWTLRRLPQSSDQNYDTLVVVTPSPADARQFAKVLAAEGMGSKILPESVSWHFAGTWGHLLPGVDARTTWPRSSDLLARSVAVGVPVRLDASTRESWSRAWQKME